MIVELHRVKYTNFKEYGHLVLSLFIVFNYKKKNCINKFFFCFFLDLDILLTDKEFSLSRELVANAIENLIDEPISSLFFHTLQKVHENYSSLNGFLSNVFVKIVKKSDWKQTRELWQAFLKCAKSVGSVAYMVLIFILLFVVNFF